MGGHNAFLRGKNFFASIAKQLSVFDAQLLTWELINSLLYGNFLYITVPSRPILPVFDSSDRSRAISAAAGRLTAS